MSQPGMGVLIKLLGGHEDSVATYKRALGKTITALSIEEHALRFTFTDGLKIKLSDEGQSCCESRYMTTDDSLAEHIGATFLSADIRDAPEEQDEYGNSHEVQFLQINTSKGSFTVANHNEHNGYYGGFAIEISMGE